MKPVTQLTTQGAPVHHEVEPVDHDSDEELAEKVVKKDDASDGAVAQSQVSTVVDEEEFLNGQPAGFVFEVDGQPLPIPPFAHPPPHEVHAAPPAALPVAVPAPMPPPAPPAPLVPSAAIFAEDGFLMPPPVIAAPGHGMPLGVPAIPNFALPAHSCTSSCGTCGKVLCKHYVRDHQHWKVLPLVIKFINGQPVVFPNNARVDRPCGAIRRLPTACAGFIGVPDYLPAGRPHLTSMGSSCTPIPLTAEPFNIPCCYPLLVNFPAPFFQNMVNRSVRAQHIVANNHGQRGPRTTYNCFFRLGCGERDMTAEQLEQHLTSRDPAVRCRFLQQYAPWKEEHDETVLIYRRARTVADAHLLRQQLNHRVQQTPGAAGVVFFLIDVSYPY